MSLPAVVDESKALRPLKDVDPKAILQRYLSDESTKDIAQSYGVTRQALGSFLLKYAEDEWRDAQVARALARKEAAEDAMEVADTVLALARARELLKSAQWDLEKLNRRLFGQDAPQQAQAVQVVINLRREAQTGENT